MNYQLTLEAFDDYRRNLSQIQLLQRKFSLQHHEAFDLTEEEFHKLMDSYNVPINKRNGSRALSLHVPYAEEGGRIKKTIFLFTSPRESKYDVLVVDVSTSVGINWIGIGLVVIPLFFMCVALFTVQPQQGIFAAAFSSLIIATIALKQLSEPVGLKDITTGFMMRQLIDANRLIADRGKFTFFHGEKRITLEELVNMAET